MKVSNVNFNAAPTCNGDPNVYFFNCPKQAYFVKQRGKLVSAKHMQVFDHSPYYGVVVNKTKQTTQGSSKLVFVMTSNQMVNIR